MWTNAGSSAPQKGIMAACVSQRRDGEINESGLTMVPRGYLRANLLMKDPASEHLISSDKSAKPIFRALQKIFNRLCVSHLNPPSPTQPTALCPPALSRLSARSTGRTGRAAGTIQKTCRGFRQVRRAWRWNASCTYCSIIFISVKSAPCATPCFPVLARSVLHMTAASLTLHSSALLAHRFPFHETWAVMHIKDIACM